MTHEHTSDFSLPWCLALSEDPNFKLIPTASRRDDESTGENSLLANALANERCIRAVKTFVKRPNLESPSAHNNIEVYKLYSLGHGVNGHPGIAHGAIVTLMLDEVMYQIVSEIHRRYDSLTARLAIKLKTEHAEGRTCESFRGEGASRVPPEQC